MPAAITDRPVRWGIIGPGRIAESFAADLALLGGGVLHAVGSRSAERAGAFADRFGAPRAHGGYAELLADDDVDVVYLATPHRQHHGIALAAIEAGRHLLVEKAFTCTLAGAEQVVHAAAAADVFVMEAMWTRFQPAVVRLRELLEGGAIGEVRAVHADLGLRVPFDPTDRLWDPEQGGGALLDLGVYPVSLVQMVLGGRPQGLSVEGTRGPNGVDAEATVLWRGQGGQHGMATCSLRSPLPGRAAIHGTDGWIEVPPRFHHPTTLLVHHADGQRSTARTEVLQVPATGGGYAHEIEEVHRCLAAGRSHSDVMPPRDTLSVMAVLEAALEQLGVAVDEDPSPL